MKFGLFPVGEALGGVVAHTVRQDDFVLKKGVVLSPGHIEAMRRIGIEAITVALMEPSDLTENEAAGRIAKVLAGAYVTVEPAFTGRANLFAQTGGVLEIDTKCINNINSLDEAITLATLPHMRRISPGEMIATVKIIPFAVADKLVEQACAKAENAVRILPFGRKKITVISTLLPSLKASVVDKTLQVLAERLRGMGQTVPAQDRRVAHQTAAITQAICDAMTGGAELIIIFGASAITDRRDLVPSAIVEAGGRIEHLGMPVDPGNLLLIGEVNGVPVIGAPGCARSPKENGFDWVLERVLAGLTVTRADIQAMGVGGLLMEIFSRPQPRTAAVHAPALPVAAVVMAAGRSTRMGTNKLLALLKGKPLVRHVVEAALASRASPVLVVTGHQDGEVRSVLDGLDVTFVHNADFAAGMAGSVAAGVAAVGNEHAGAVILLGDMPLVTPALINRLIDCFGERDGLSAVVPVAGGRRGNPVLLSRSLFAQVMQLTGDSGARMLLEQAGDMVAEVLVDVDTRKALEALTSRV
jgi:molybdenum cofactor cytidylyltransferase